MAFEVSLDEDKIKKLSSLLKINEVLCKKLLESISLDLDDSNTINSLLNNDSINEGDRKTIFEILSNYAPFKKYCKIEKVAESIRDTIKNIEKFEEIHIFESLNRDVLNAFKDTALYVILESTYKKYSQLNESIDPLYVSKANYDIQSGIMSFLNEGIFDDSANDGDVNAGSTSSENSNNASQESSSDSDENDSNIDAKAEEINTKSPEHFENLEKEFKANTTQDFGIKSENGEDVEKVKITGIDADSKQVMIKKQDGTTELVDQDKISPLDEEYELDSKALVVESYLNDISKYIIIQTTNDEKELMEKLDKNPFASSLDQFETDIAERLVIKGLLERWIGKKTGNIKYVKKVRK